MKEKINNDQNIHQLGNELFILILEKLNAEKKDDYSRQKEVTCFSNQNMLRLLRGKKSCLITIQINLED